MRSLIAVLCLIAPGMSSAWELDVVAMLTVPTASQYADTGSITIRAGNDWYGWLDYTQGDIERLTQDLGQHSTLSAGIGYRSAVGRVRPYIEAGVAVVDVQTNGFAARETIYHGFLPTFGIPPFRADGRFDLLAYDYRMDRAPVIRIGATIDAGSNLDIDIGYRVQRPREVFAIWNPTWNGGPAENAYDCGCMWMGSGRTTMDSIYVGVAHRFDL